MWQITNLKIKYQYCSKLIFFSILHLKKNVIHCLEQQKHFFFFLNTATNFKPQISQCIIKEFFTSNTKRSGSFSVWESTLNFKFSQSLFSCFRETCPILSSSDSSPDVSNLQHLNWLHPWNTLWLGKTTVDGWKSRARRLTWKNQQKLHVPQALFLLDLWNWATSGLGWHRNVEMMLNLVRSSQLHICPVFLNPKRSCSNSKGLTTFYNRGLCFSLFVLKKCLKILSQQVLLLKGIGEKHKQTLEVERNHPLTNLLFQRCTAAAPVDVLSPPV